MDIKQFYDDLAEWVLMINQNSQSMTKEKYWEYIIKSAGELSRKYNEGPLVQKVILAHVAYLEEAWKDQQT